LTRIDCAWLKRLKPKYVEPLSNVARIFSLPPCTKVMAAAEQSAAAAASAGRRKKKKSEEPLQAGPDRLPAT
jgi:hypothetical protein